MRVKLCARCPYTPQDLASHYDSEAALHLCAKCDVEQAMLINHYPREAYRRRPCATISNVFETAQRNVAQSVTETLVSSGTTAGELPYVQRSASNASTPARMAIADGYAGFKPPEDSCTGNDAEISCRSELRIEEAAQ